MSRLLMLLALLPIPALADAPVTVSVEVSGRETPLYPARDGSGKLYVEARVGASYAVHLRNETGERLGVALDVDGLNVIDGRLPGGRERMYVLNPYETTVVRGWRSSLSDVHLFTFVDEAASYASRTGQANGRLGWIEAKVWRERRPIALNKSMEAPPATVPPGASADAAGAPRARAYPGTGWGAVTNDQAVEVTFDPESAPCQLVTLRYEYRPALVALGVVPRPYRDRLLERERGQFAQPPVD